MLRCEKCGDRVGHSTLQTEESVLPEIDGAEVTCSLQIQWFMFLGKQTNFWVKKFIWQNTSTFTWIISLNKEENYIAVKLVSKLPLAVH